MTAPRHLARAPRPCHRPTALAALLLLHGAASALPEGPQATAGQVAVTRPDGRTMLVQQGSSRAAIDWTSFSIGRGETVRFAMPDSRSIAVNRVLGQDPSAILGRLQANGQVFLINPRGIVFGRDAQVDVGALVASSLSLSNADLAAGRWRLGQGAAGATQGAGAVPNEGAAQGAGAVRNEGTIVARDGTVVLAAPQVANEGTIRAARIGLAAAAEVMVDLDGDGLVTFASRAADAARLDQLGTLDAGGGRIELRASARGALAQTVLNLRGTVMARGLASHGGEIVIDGGASGVTLIDGRVDASGTRGGTITAGGESIGIGREARLDASGRDGGGEILVGGALHGAPLAGTGRATAARVAVAAGAQLDASAGEAGDGGRIVVWADEQTRFAGDAAARGGAQGGHGGFAEVSAKGRLDYRGRTDLRAPQGRAGRLLLDPFDLTIEASAPDANGDGTAGDDLAAALLPFNAPGTSSRITGAAVTAQLALGAVTLQADHDITVNDAIVSPTANGLTLAAGNDINLNGLVQLANAPLTLSSNDPGSSLRLASGRVSIGGSLDIGSGALRVTNNGGTGQHLIGGAQGTGPVTIRGDALLSGPLATTALTIAAGTLTLGFSDLLADTATVTLDGGNLELDGNRDTIGTLSLVNGNLTDFSVGAGLDAASFQLQSGTVTATLGGSGSLVKLGAGTVVLAGFNQYTGSTTVDAGTLQLAGSAALPFSTVLTVNGGTLDLGGALATVGSAALNGGSIVDTAGGGSLDAPGGFTISAGTIGARLTGTGSLVKSGPGLGRLTNGSNDYAGGTQVQAGTLALDATEAAGIGDIAVAAGARLELGAGTITGNNITLDGGTLANPAGTATVTGTIGLAADSTIEAAGTLTVDSAIDGGRTGFGFDKTGPGVLALGAANLYGRTNVLAGTLRLTQAGASAGLDPVTLAPGTVLELDGGAGLIVALNSAGTVRVLGGASQIADLNLGGDTVLETVGGPLTVSGPVGGSGTLTKAGADTATLAAPAGFTGNLAVNAGTLVVNGTLYAFQPTPGNVGIAGGATLDLGANLNDITIGSLSMSAGSLLSLGGGTFTLAGGSVAGRIGSGASLGALALAPGGTLTLQPGAQVAAAISVPAGTLDLAGPDVLSNAGRASSLSLGDDGVASVAFDQTLDSLSVDGGRFDGNGTLTAAQYALGDVSGSGTTIGNLGGGNTGSQGAMRFSGDVGLASFTVNNPVVFDLARNVTTATRFNGGGTLTKTGSATLTMLPPGAGASDFAGGTTVAAGTLRLLGAGAVPGTGNVTVAAAATLDVAGGATIGNAVTLAGGTLASSSGSGTLTGNVTLTADASIAVAGTGTLTLGGSLQEQSAGLGLTIAGGGVLVLGAPGFTSGTTTVADGTLRLAATGATPGSGPIVVPAGSTLELQNSGNLLNPLQLGGTLRNLAGANSVGSAIALTADATAEVAGGTLTTSLITGGFGLTKTGSGTLTFGAAGLYSGPTVVSAGTLATAGADFIDDASAVTIAAGATLSLGGSEALGPLGGSGTLATASTLTLGGSGGFERFDGTITGAGALVKSGLGRLTLGGPSNFTGGTEVQAGTLAFDSAAARAGSGAITVRSGATLAADNAAAIVNPLTLDGGTLASSAGSGRFDGPVTLSADSQLGGDGVLAIGGAIDGTAGGGFGLAHVGSGTTVLSNAGNAYRDTLVIAGTLALDGGAGRAGAGAILVNAGATLDLRNGGNVVANALTLDGGTLDSSTGNGRAGAPTLASDSILSAGFGSTLTVQGALGGAGGFTKQGLGTVVLGVPAGYGGATTIADGTLRLQAANLLPASTDLVLLAAGTLDIGAFDQRVATQSLGGTVLGSGLLNAASTTLAGGSIDTRLGDGSLNVTGNTTLNNTAASDTITVTQGTLTLAATATLTNAPVLTVQDGGTLAIASSQTVASAALAGAVSGSGTLNSNAGFALDGASVSANLGAGPLTSSGSSTLSGNAAVTTLAVQAGTLTVSGGGRLNALPTTTVAGGATLTLAGNETLGSLAGSGGVAISNGTLTTGGNGASTVFDGTISGSGGLVKAGPGTMTLGGASSYSGATTISGGTLATTSAERLPDASALVIGGGAQLSLGGNETVGSLAGAGALALGAFTLAAGGDNSNTTFSGSAAGSGGLTKLGNGTLTLAGVQAYTGATTVNGGTLVTAGDRRLAAATALAIGNARVELGGNETVATLSLDGGTLATAGTSTGSPQLTATRLNSSGSSTLAAATSLGTLQVDGGTLAVSGDSARLLGAPAVTVQDGATLQLAAAENVGVIANAGTIEAPAALNAGAIGGAGNLRFGRSVSTVGDLVVGGVLTVSTPQQEHRLQAGGALVATNPLNDLGSGRLVVEAQSAQLVSAGTALNLGAVTLGGGTSSLVSAGTLDLGADFVLGDGTLTITANAPRSSTGTDPLPGSTVLLPGTSSGQAANRLQFALPTITQSGGRLSTGAGSALVVLAPGGGSVLLDRDGNAFGGTLSVRTGAGGRFVYTSGRPDAEGALSLADRVAVNSATPLTVAGSGLDADVIQLRAPGLATAAGAALHVRLPFAGAGAALPGLLLDLSPVVAEAGGGVFGGAGTPLTVTHEQPFNILLSVTPQRALDLPLSVGVYLACLGATCAASPAYEWGAQPGAVPVFYNGQQITDAPPRNNAISSNTSLLENARRTLFEEAVRTENVAPRLRAGVIAEVGAGRPATEGREGLARPAGCEPAAGTLACAGPAR